MGATPGNEGGMEVDAATPATSTSKNPQIDQAKVEEGIASAKTQAAAGARQEAIQALLSIEQKGRLAEDITSTQRACTAILEVRTTAPWAWAGMQRGGRPATQTHPRSQSSIHRPVAATPGPLRAECLPEPDLLPFPSAPLRFCTTRGTGQGCRRCCW